MGGRRVARKERPASEGGGVGRTCARAARRRAARNKNASLVSCEIETERAKTILSAEEEEELLSCIRKGQQARFGIRKLMQIDLDRTSLLREALSEGQDAIAFAILQGGASILPEYEDELSQSLTQCVRLFSPSAQVWIAAFLKSAYDARQSKVGKQSGQIHESACRCDSCEVILQDEFDLLEWPQCLHAICSTCTAQALSLSASSRKDSKSSALSCPSCGIHQPDDQPPPALLTLGAPEEIRRQSLEMFEALPLKFIKALHATPKPKLVRQSPTIAKYEMPGDTQDRRMEKFLNAVLDGDAPRVRALIDLGIDVDARDQHGATALIWATMLPQAHHIINLLLDAGASPNLQCNLGVSQVDLTLNLSPPWAPAQGYQVQTAIPWSKAHPGAGSFVIDNACSRSCATYLLETSQTIEPVAMCPNAPPAAERRYLLDSQGWIRALLSSALQQLENVKLLRVYPAMRTLTYSPGISLAPHIDLHRTDRDGLTSTHTFILYLEGDHGDDDISSRSQISGHPDSGDGNEVYPTESFSNKSGGETALLASLKTPEVALYVVSPKPCRLLVFPHKCPHEGRLVHASKVILRGEIAMVYDDDKTSG
mmetsp:Transcript_10253/g.20087  ORF Transcript_10253/g.20087 Transcript_10253/m.20087 type:complete len:598 (-) Transcript_10253:352-2145(-)|eukprot:CAMPEP_0171566234 /NCGR_PEP_ID=MMETSP0961-20121227/446_1 /TAXON_ID=87120 /ORGANISM="Aurantiochytrium limacinum, Strain ATCCMYA-1381" /LENGTH=597 /DNA_ID=CAMNT_0012119931 /DNA_START=318 /DNA_END=2111 /DNA_ORIENTATION=+